MDVTFVYQSRRMVKSVSSSEWRTPSPATASRPTARRRSAPRAELRVVRDVGKAEDGLGDAEHGACGVDAGGVGFGEEPAHERGEAVAELGVGAVEEHLAHELGDEVRGDADDTDRSGFVSRVVALVVVTRPARHAVIGVLLDSSVPFAFFHAREIFVRGELELSSPARYLDSFSPARCTRSPVRDPSPLQSVPTTLSWTSFRNTD